MTHAALFPFKCTGCGHTIHEGEPYEYTEDDEHVGHTCCGSFSVTTPPQREAIAQVMPRGRTKADACPRCFQVPSNNGVCGCS